MFFEFLGLSRPVFNDNPQALLRLPLSYFLYIGVFAISASIIAFVIDFYI